MIETPSDRDYACFFCPGTKQKDLNGSCPSCGRPINIGPYAEGQSIAGYKLDQYVARGFYGATYQATNRIGIPVALKIVPTRLYQVHGKSFQEEIQNYSRLGSHENIAELRDAGEGSVELDGDQLPVFFLVMEWVEGVTLTEFIRTTPLNASMVYGAVNDVAAGLSRFEAANLWHNDLNSDNIKVKRLTPEEIQVRRSESPYILKILDTGSAVFRQAFRRKALDDLLFLGQHTNALVVVARRNEATMPLEDRFFLDQLGTLASSLLDEDPSRRISLASKFGEQVTELYLQRRYLLSEDENIRLHDPFEYLNANDFPNESYVNRLFSSRFPWISDTILPAAQSMLITGPRGSGKTIILRSMRLKTRFSPVRDGERAADIAKRLERDRFVAFFVSARLEIGNHSLLTKIPRWMESDELVLYYFHLLYAYEVCDTLIYGQLKNILKIDRDAEFRFCKFLEGALGEAVVSVSSALAAIKTHQAAVLASQLKIDDGSRLLGATFLTDLCSHVRAMSLAFASKRFVFLLDDFSAPKVPERVQRVLLPIIWNSGGGYTFRVSAHSESTELIDLRKNTYVANRDFRELNLGAVYINSIDIDDVRDTIDACVNEIVQKRFELSAEELKIDVKKTLGKSPTVSIAQEIKERSQRKSLRALRFFGWGTVVSLCSGDISYVIDLLGKMFEQTTKIARKRPIGARTQNRVIRQYARQELYRLQDYSGANCNLYEIALNFGKMSRFKLLNEEVRQTGARGSRPAEYLRIEVQISGFADEVRSSIAELVRNGVFIDGGFSSSSQAIPARRLIFRKVFTPAFPTTFNSRDTFSMTAPHFLEFVRDPEVPLRLMMGKLGIPPSEQQITMDALFDPDVR
jgi:tRNA A-37 threonylcarbamoyl transferase component Bud32